MSSPEYHQTAAFHFHFLTFKTRSFVSTSAIALSSNVIYSKLQLPWESQNTHDLPRVIKGFSFLLSQFGCAAGESRAQAAGVDGAYGAVTTELTWWAGECWGSQGGGQNSYAKTKRGQFGVGELITGRTKGWA